MSMEKIVARLIDKVERRFYGKYRGFVVDNADPEQLGRLKLQVPSLLGDAVVTGWALPCMPYGGDANQGMLFIPEVGAGVWVEFEEGDLEFPLWMGTFWSKPGGTSELPLPNQADGTEESAVQDPPTRKIIKTRKGHTLQFEDKDNDEMVTLVEATHGHVLTMNQDGITTIDGTNGHAITLDANGITVTDGVNRHEMGLSAQGISIEDGSNQHRIVLEASGITIEAQSGAIIHITPAGISVDAGSGMVQVKGQSIMLSASAALPVLRVTDQGVGNLGAPVIMTGPGNPMVLA